MAQRYPDDFDGIFRARTCDQRVGLQHAGTRAGLATMGEGWIRPAQVELVAERGAAGVRQGRRLG